MLPMGTRRAAIPLDMYVVFAAEGATVALELVHGHGREGGGSVMAGRFVVDFVDRDSGVHDVRLNGFLLDDRLDCFVDVVVHLLALHHGRLALRVGSVGHGALVPQLAGLGPEGAVGGLVIAVVEFPVDDAGGLVVVLLGQDLAVVNGLHDAMVVVLVDFLVDGRGDFLVSGGVDRLVRHGRSGLLLHLGVVLPSVGHEVVDLGLGALHVEILVRLGCRY